LKSRLNVDRRQFIEDLKEVSGQAVAKLMRSAADSTPEILYHSTDTPGLLGIISSGSPWASLATSPNDPLETLSHPTLPAV
jgi:hypothetical protein